MGDKETEAETFRTLYFRMYDEGFHYCFTSYSNWEEVDDDEFQKLLAAYKSSAETLEHYIINKHNKLNND